MTNDPFKIVEHNVYYNEKELKGVSSNGFIVLTENILKNEKGVWFFHSRGKGITKFLTGDIANFQVINSDYARDSKDVFLLAKGGFCIPNSDVDSFEVLTNTTYFSKDRNQLYALDTSSGLSVYKNADFDSIVHENFHQFLFDNHNLYHYGIELNVSNDQKYLHYLDHSSFHEKGGEKSIFQANREFLSKHFPKQVGWWHSDYPFQIEIESIDDVGFYKTKNAVFHLEKSHHLEHSVPTLLPQTDHQSFTKINDQYGKDKANVYFRSRAIPGADVKTFHLINSRLAKDKNNYYYDGNKIECDFHSFEPLGSYEIFYRDKNTLFSMQEVRQGRVGFRYEIRSTLTPIKKSSPDTIKLFSRVWAKDDNHVYRYGKIFKKADTNTFTYLDIKSRYEWAKDKVHLFNSSSKTILKGIDGTHFQALNRFWGKDKNKVVFFLSEGVQPSIDARTFTITDDLGGAIDKNYVYSLDGVGGYKKKKI